jgi:TatD DNase family protein
MIDSHCHLEQKDYEGKLETFIEKWKKDLSLIVSSCAHPGDLDRTLAIYNKFKPFVKICIGLHPEFIKEVDETQVKRTIEFIRKNRESISAIGEIGLDYHWITEPEFRQKQKELFIRFIDLAKELNLPVVTHSRDATAEVVEILEQRGMVGKKVLMHLMQDRQSLPKIIENGWLISIGPGIAKSKGLKKIARDAPLDRILLETDSPWFKQDDQAFGEPVNVKVVCEKIAEIKKISMEEVDRVTTENARKFFNHV